MAQALTPARIPADLDELTAEELRTLVTRLGSTAKANLSVPISKAKKADLIAALEKTRPAPTGKASKAKGGGTRSFTDSQAEQVVSLRHDELLSWRQIADELGFGTPGVARRAYRSATGHEGVLPRIPGKPGRPTAAMVAGEEEPMLLGQPAPKKASKAKAKKAA